MKTKHALFILVSGFCLTAIGALMKIMHWPYSTDILFAATFIKVFGFVSLAYKVTRNPKVREFFNS